MISSFSPEDRSFFEREFAFFDEVTDISGKLKPLVGAEKPVKAQKIEEELRKIKVDVVCRVSWFPSRADEGFACAAFAGCGSFGDNRSGMNHCAHHSRLGIRGEKMRCLRRVQIFPPSFW